MSETLLINGRVIDPASKTDGVRHIAIKDGRITELSQSPFDAKRLSQATVIDAAGKLVLPGLVDLHVHLREPGEEYKETIVSGTGAALAGGFTAVVSMPNTKPVNDCASITEYILKRAGEAGKARVHPAGAISKGQKGEELAEIGEMVSAGCKVFTDDGKPVTNAKLMRRVLEYAQAFDVPVMVHEEDPQLAGGGAMHEGTVSTKLGLRGIPALAETTMLARDLGLLELTRGRLHVAHVSCAGSVELIRQAKAKGLRVTAEATPHHFTLTDQLVDESCYDTNTRVNPPLRAESDRKAVLQGLADGTLDAIATDHAPHSPIEKDLEYDRAACGLIGLETALPLALAQVRAGAFDLMRMVELFTTGPCRALSLPGGALAVGAEADIAIVAQDEEWVVDVAKLRSKSRNTPFAGRKMQGRVKKTLVGGKVLFSDEG